MRMSLLDNEKVHFDDTTASQYISEENHFEQNTEVEVNTPEATHNSPTSIASLSSFVNEKRDEEKVPPILIGNLRSNHPSRGEFMEARVISATFEDSDVRVPEQNLTNLTLHYPEINATPSSKCSMPESSFEEQCAREWKAREEFEREQRRQLEKYLKESRELFVAEMEIKTREHKTKMMKQDLLLRRQRLEQQRKNELEARHLEQISKSMLSNDAFTEDLEPKEPLISSRTGVHTKKMCDKLQRNDEIIDDQVNKQYNIPSNVPTINERESSSLNDQASNFHADSQTLQHIYSSVMNSENEFDEGLSSNRIGVNEITANAEAGSSSQRAGEDGQSKPYKCRHCPKQYQHRCNLITHMKLHDENKRIKCDVCFKLFATNSQYRVHMNSHTGEKLHFCSVCNRGFRQREYLKRHEKKHLRKFKSLGGQMVASGERKMECFQCKKKFTHIATLIRHENIHKNIRPFECNYCGKKFTQSGNLTTHVRIHTGEKPFKCDYCDKGFARRDNRKIHMNRCEFREGINSFPAISNSPQSREGINSFPAICISPQSREDANSFQAISNSPQGTADLVIAE